ncbi:MAG: hypothetical protein OXF02_06480, partial [Simkaniaceae bacterium]|nr:hypothetical protein [Simkaniaceae bacterium]
RKTTPRSQRATVHAPEEVVTERPKAESPSPEPEPTKGGWLSLSGWFAKPSEEAESVDGSSARVEGDMGTSPSL